jgi:hypothetical protein
MSTKRAGLRLLNAETLIEITFCAIAQQFIFARLIFTIKNEE